MRKILILASLAVMLAACSGGASLTSNGGSTTGGSSSGSSSSGGSSSGSSSGTSVTPASLSLAASSTTIPVDGSASVTITAIADTASNVALEGVGIAFGATTGGNLVVGNSVTNASGAAVATLTAVGSPAVGSTITVTAKAGTLSKTVTLTFVSNTTAPTVVSMGSGSGSSFLSGKIYISTPTLSAGGSTTLQVNLIDQNGAAYTQSTTVTFSSPCVGNNQSSITGLNSATGVPTTTTTSGTATATYVTSGCSGSDLITATASANGQNLSATGTVTVTAASLGSISFISASPTTITLKGQGSAGGSSTSTVVFQVNNSTGGPLEGATVNFALSTMLGGVSLTPASGTTAANGQVQTIVSSGTVAEPVTVEATTTVGGSTLSTSSNSLTISTGVPTSDGISLAVECENVEAWDADGVSVPVTVRMRDRFSNPVPDGTTVNFHTLLGHIDSSCQTGSTAETKGTGTCSVNWVSQAPRSVAGNPQSAYNAAYPPAGTTPVPDYYPYYASYCETPLAGASPPFGTPTGLPLCNGTTNGRSPIVAYTVGEERFIDTNNSGVFNSTLDTVPFNASNPWNSFGTFTGPWGEDPSNGTSTYPNGAPKSWQDVGDPFLNSWELYTCYASGTVCDPIYVLGEYFYDFFNTGVWAPPDELIESALCDADTSPAPSVSYCNPTSTTVGISASNVIILSGNVPSVTFEGPGYTVLPPNGSITLPYGVIVQISDERYQQMPAGTTVNFAIVPSTAGTINGTSSFVWPCTGALGGQAYAISMVPQTSGATSGALQVTVSTPGNSQTKGVTTVTSYSLTN